MCYSAQIKADYARFAREYGAVISLKDFYELFWRRLKGSKIVIPRGVEGAFSTPQSDEELEVKKLIVEYFLQRDGELMTKLAFQSHSAAGPRSLVEPEPIASRRTGRHH